MKEQTAHKHLPLSRLRYCEYRGRFLLLSVERYAILIVALHNGRRLATPPERGWGPCGSHYISDGSPLRLLWKAETATLAGDGFLMELFTWPRANRLLQRLSMSIINRPIFSCQGRLAWYIPGATFYFTTPGTLLYFTLSLRLIFWFKISVLPFFHSPFAILQIIILWHPNLISSFFEEIKVWVNSFFILS